jgi:biotin carboxyl carrier protein
MKISARAGSHVYEIVIDRENGHYVVEVGGERHTVDVQKLEGDFYTILNDGRSYEVSVEASGDGYTVRHGAAVQRVEMSDPGRRAREMRDDTDGPTDVVATMPGKVVRILVAEGDTVEAGQGVAVVEAMKMENELPAPKGGKVRSVAVSPGQSVDGGATLLTIE